jgi:hypothetical protein
MTVTNIIGLLIYIFSKGCREESGEKDGERKERERKRERKERERKEGNVSKRDILIDREGEKEKKNC